MINLELNYVIECSDVNKIKNSWKLYKKSWGHSLHRICSRICSFPPSLAYFFVKNFSKKGDVCLDVFSGKGTFPLEAMLNERIAIGNDIAPDAFILTNAKLNPPDVDKYIEYLDELKGKMGFLSTTKGVNKNIRIFFGTKTLKQILEIRELLMDDESQFGIFSKALMCGILHGKSSISLSLPCSHSYSMAPSYVRKYAKKHGLKKPRRDVIECLKIKAKTVLKDPIPPRFNSKAFNYDSRNLPLKEESVDLIVTSPPYFDVQTYAYDNWLRLWFLGYDYREVRKNIVQTGSEKLYKEFMSESLVEMYRVLKKNRRCFIIVGDVKKKYANYEKIINTAEFLSKPAQKAGFKVERIIRDSIPQCNKVLNSSLNTEGITTERILCLRK